MYITSGIKLVQHVRTRHAALEHGGGALMVLGCNALQELEGLL